MALPRYRSRTLYNEHTATLLSRKSQPKCPLKGIYLPALACAKQGSRKSTTIRRHIKLVLQVSLVLLPPSDAFCGPAMHVAAQMNLKLYASKQKPTNTTARRHYLNRAKQPKVRIALDVHFGYASERSCATLYAATTAGLQLRNRNSEHL